MMRFRKISGFTLLELGLVLVVLSLMVGGLLSIATQNIRIAKKKELEMKMDAIEEAVIAYRKANGFIPCPGGVTFVEADVDYGFQGFPAGTCTNGIGSLANPATFFSSGNTVGGMVPVRTLGLPDDYARDPWGNKFFYVVDKRATAASTFAVSKLTSTSLIGSITVKDYSNTSITTTAVMLLMSFGPNGHGAYVGSSRKYVGSINRDEWYNCDCNATTSTAFDNVFSSYRPTDSNTALDNFDDIVRYYSRTRLSSIDDIETETR